MTTRRVSLAVAALFLVLTFRPLAQEQAVPADLKPLLAAPQSEMRMVVQRYTLDRQTLSGNYANGAARGGRGGRGRGADASAMPAPPPLVPMSPARIARLKRFDTNWQAALARVDAAKLTGAAKTDFETLKSAVSANLAQLDVETLTMRQALVVAPFAPRLVQLVEARIRVEDMDSQRAAGVLTDVTKEIAKLVGRGAARESRAGDTRRERRGAAARHYHRVVQFLQWLRSAIHLVDGDAVRARWTRG